MEWLKKLVNNQYMFATVNITDEREWAKGVPKTQKKETQARANCSAVPTQLALCLRLAIDL